MTAGTVWTSILFHWNAYLNICLLNYVHWYFQNVFNCILQIKWVFVHFFLFIEKIQSVFRCYLWKILFLYVSGNWWASILLWLMVRKWQPRVCGMCLCCPQNTNKNVFSGQYIYITSYIYACTVSYATESDEQWHSNHIINRLNKGYTGKLTWYIKANS